MSQFQRNKREILKEQALQYLGGKKCLICGTEFLPICCYDFHHSKGAKEQNISKLLGEKNTLDDEFKKELEKCKVVCANCHRQVTARIIVIKYDT